MTTEGAAIASITQTVRPRRESSLFVAPIRRFSHQIRVWVSTLGHWPNHCTLVILEKMKTLLPLLILLTFSTCSCAPDDVEGVVQFRGTPAEGAQVSLGELKTMTNANGEFSFTAVPEGSYGLRAELSLQDGRVVAAHEVVEVDWSIPDVTVQLPAAIELSVSALTARTLTLQWTPTTSSEFQEYRVYRTPLEGLPAALIYIERCIDNVVYFDDWDIPDFMSVEYFYRVIAVDSIGLIGQSNVLKVTSPPLNTTTSTKRYSLEEESKSAGEVQTGGMCWYGGPLASGYWTDTGR
jgi:hypothetical protein